MHERRKFVQQTMIERTCNQYIPQLPTRHVPTSYLFSKLCSSMEKQRSEKRISNLIFCKKLLRAHFAKYECGFGRSANAFLNVMTHEYGETLFIRYLFVLHMSHQICTIVIFLVCLLGQLFPQFFLQKNVFPISTFPYLNTIWRKNSYYLSTNQIQL